VKRVHVAAAVLAVGAIALVWLLLPAALSLRLGPEAHTLEEGVAATMAFVTGLLALLRFYSRNSNTDCSWPADS
jgi:hypothetical protein